MFQQYGEKTSMRVADNVHYRPLILDYSFDQFYNA